MLTQEYFMQIHPPPHVPGGVKLGLIGGRRKEPVALVAASDLSSWMETEYLLRSPRNAERLRDAMARADAGEGLVIELDELGRRLGLTEG